MYTIRKRWRIAFRHPGVRTLDAGMAMAAVASACDVLEPVSVAGNGPRLSERDAPRACRLADQAIHTAIEVVRNAAPSSEICPNTTITPVQAGFRPFNGYTPAISETGVCHLTEGPPEAAE